MSHPTVGISPDLGVSSVFSIVFKKKKKTVQFSNARPVGNTAVYVYIMCMHCAATVSTEALRRNSIFPIFRARPTASNAMDNNNN